MRLRCSRPTNAGCVRGSRPKPFTFCPSKGNRLVISLCKRILPYVIRRKLKVTRIEIGDDDLEKLKTLKGRRCLLMPSHSGGFEPYVVLHLSKLLGNDYIMLSSQKGVKCLGPSCESNAVAAKIRTERASCS